MSSWDIIGGIAMGTLLLSALYTLHSGEKRRDARILSDMKSTFFPRLSDNLRTITQRLEEEATLTYSYEEQLYSGLSRSLIVEFKLRFPRQGSILSKLRDDLAKYDEALLTKSDETSGRGEAVSTMKLGLQGDIYQLLKDVEKLMELERLPLRHLMPQ